MSKYWEIIQRVNEVAPNPFSEERKFGWLMELEGKLAADVLQLHIAEIRAIPNQYNHYTMQCEPLVGYPHEEMYDLWLKAKIHEASGEYDLYQNVMQLYNGAYSNFVRWYAHTYQTARGRQHHTHCGCDEYQGYFLTAYGIAWMRGFRGTVDEWLRSLVGAPGKAGKSAYEYAVEKGYTGTEEEFGRMLQTAKSAYQYALEGGYTGSEEQFRQKMAMEYAEKGHGHGDDYAPKNHGHGDAYAPKSHSHGDSYSPKDHKHSAEDFTDGTLSVDRLPMVPIEKGGTGGENRHSGFTNLAYIGRDPLTVENDTVETWVALGNGFAGISKICTQNQPYEYGTIINLLLDSNVHQLFISLNGELLFRGGDHVSGWVFPWKAVLTKDGGVMTGPVTMKGIHLTPGVDYGKTFPEDAQEGRLFWLEVDSDG